MQKHLVITRCFYSTHETGWWTSMEWDFYIACKEETRQQVENAGYMVEKIWNYMKYKNFMGHKIEEI